MSKQKWRVERGWGEGPNHRVKALKPPKRVLGRSSAMPFGFSRIGATTIVTCPVFVETELGVLYKSSMGS